MNVISYDDAFLELQNNFSYYSSKAGRADLLALTQQVDATNSTGQFTMAYSGGITNDLHTRLGNRHIY